MGITFKVAAVQVTRHTLRPVLGTAGAGSPLADAVAEARCRAQALMGALTEGLQRMMSCPECAFVGAVAVLAGLRQRVGRPSGIDEAAVVGAVRTAAAGADVDQDTQSEWQLEQARGSGLWECAEEAREKRHQLAALFDDVFPDRLDAYVGAVVFVSLSAASMTPSGWQTGVWVSHVERAVAANRAFETRHVLLASAS